MYTNTILDSRILRLQSRYDFALWVRVQRCAEGPGECYFNVLSLKEQVLVVSM